MRGFVRRAVLVALVLSLPGCDPLAVFAAVAEAALWVPCLVFGFMALFAVAYAWDPPAGERPASIALAVAMAAASVVLYPGQPWMHGKTAAEEVTVDAGPLPAEASDPAGAPAQERPAGP